MPGVAVDELARGRVEHPQHEGDEAPVGDLSRQRRIHASADAIRSKRRRERTDGGREVRGEESRRDALARHVRNGHGQPIALDERDVEGVAPDARRRPPVHGELEARDDGERVRKQTALDVAGILDLAPQAAGLQAARAALVDLRPDQRDERLVVPGFLHEMADALPHGFDGELDGAPSGHGHNRQERFDGPDALDEREPFDARRRIARVVQIHQEKVDLTAGEPGHDLIRRRDGLGPEAFRAEQQPQRFEHVGLIVGDEDSRSHVALGHELKTDQKMCHGGRARAPRVMMVTTRRARPLAGRWCSFLE